MGVVSGVGALRRSHLVGLAAVGMLLLLLLAARAPAPPPPRPRPAPRPLAYSSAPVNNATAPHSASHPASHPVSHSASHPAPRSANNTTVSKSAGRTSPRTPPRPRAVLTSDMYEAGHSRPHPELCPALGARVRLLVLVSSAPSHSVARDAVRLTWGHYAARADIAFAFVLGTPPLSMQPAVEAEDALYGDIIIGRSLDSYSNLTLKTLSMLEWADTYCPRAPRLLKTDDDMFINIPRLLKFSEAHANDTRTIWGKVVHKSLPKRTTKSKYYVSPLQFPGKVFPDFATGPAYLVTTDIIRPLLEAAGREPYVRLEDVFVTGVLASKLGVRRRHAPEFYNKKVAAHPCAVQRGIAIHMVQYHEQFDLWRKLLDGKTKCAS